MTISVNKNTVIVFDLDDTLYNEVDFLKSAFQDIAYNLDKKNHLSLCAYMFSMHRDRKDVFQYIISKYNISKETLIQEYRDHIPKIKPFKHAVNLLKNIKENNGKTAIITDGRKTTQLNKIKSLGISDLSDKIIISEEIGSEKPSIENYKAIENHFNAKSYTYIADNLKKDFITPNLMGWNTIGLVDNGLNIHFTNYQYFTEKQKPKFFISGFKELKVIS